MRKGSIKNEDIRQRRLDIVQMLVDGHTHTQIKESIAKAYGISEFTVRDDIEKATEILKSYRDHVIEATVNLHLQRYEDLYNITQEFDMDAVALKVLQKKEILMGFHKDGIKIHIDNRMEIEETESVKVFDIDKLGTEKRERMEQLLNKCSRNGNVNHRS